MEIQEEYIETKAEEELEKNYEMASELIKDTDRLERFLQRLEAKLRKIPLAGDKFAMLPVLISLVKSFAKKEYTDIPVGCIVAIVGALIYFLSPVDLIPDVIPGVGHLDDAAVIVACLKLVESDVDEYVKWRKDNGKVLYEDFSENEEE